MRQRRRADVSKLRVRVWNPDLGRWQWFRVVRYDLKQQAPKRKGAMAVTHSLAILKHETAALSRVGRRRKVARIAAKTP